MLDEAHGVATFILGKLLSTIGAELVDGEPLDADSYRYLLALTIATVTSAERSFRSLGREHPENWESLERSASVFTDEHIVKWLAKDDPLLKRAITKQRKRKLAARAGGLCLVESARDKRARWVAVTYPEGGRIPIAEEVAENLNELTWKLDDRIEEFLTDSAPHDPLALTGRIVGVLSAAEVLLALVPSNKVAAFCVLLASLVAERAP